jgi:protein-S-isoprenylcysteine O-methyltransferase Ste14
MRSKSAVNSKLFWSGEQVRRGGADVLPYIVEFVIAVAAPLTTNVISYLVLGMIFTHRNEQKEGCMRPRYVAYALLGFFFVTEPLLRQGKAASSRQEGPADRGSTHLIGAAFGLALFALLVAPLLNRLKIGRLRSEPLAWSGIMAMFLGLALRIWASRVLGAFYTRTLRTSTQQHLIAKGPYRLVRHPGYLAALLMWLGAGFATANWIALVSCAIPMMGAYWYRIRAEEAMLADAFPQEYPNYASRTWRLVPFLY